MNMEKLVFWGSTWFYILATSPLLLQDDDELQVGSVAKKVSPSCSKFLLLPPDIS